MKRYACLLLVPSYLTYAAEPENMEVTGKRYSWLDSAQTASEGKVDEEQLKERPVLRPGEILEAVPGLIATQHSGTGKANQYFLRGFNLDHGTDFATFVDGVPINMPSHGHGQGYTDVNFLIPELIEMLSYSKGPYSVLFGDFSGAGGVEIKTKDVFPQGLVKYSAGSYDYHRLLLMDSVAINSSDHLSYAVEGKRYQGPWSDINERLRNNGAWLKYVHPLEGGQVSFNLQHYDARWNAADQIPARAVDQGLIDRLGSIDKTVGGESSRDSLNGLWQKKSGDNEILLQLYAVRYALNLWSNFSYFLENPIDGDQFEQEDRRTIAGASAVYRTEWSMGGIPSVMSLGVQNRYDRIENVGLYQTMERQRLGTKAESAVRENEIGVFVEQQFQWTQQFKSSIAVRHDEIFFKNEDRLDEETRRASDQLTSPKVSTSYAPLEGWQLFASAGQSFHSNDARGVTSAAEKAPGLVPVRGYEVGSSYEIGKMGRVSLALWRLQLDSELVYIGDAGTTEPSLASRREGVDWLLQIAPNALLHADLELSWAKARFKSSPEGEGDQVEGHLPFVAMLGIGSQLNREWSASARFRHFGSRPLTADGSQTSQATSILNLHLAYEEGGWEASLDGLNALNSKDHDIDYYYESKLAGEADPVADLHYHPVEPTSIRFNLGKRF